MTRRTRRKARSRKPKTTRPTSDSSRELPTAEVIRAVNDALRQAYGRPTPQSRRDPVDGLIGTILSQNTTSSNSRAAFNELKRRFPTWVECLAAPTAAVVDAIRCAGLAEIRGPRIQEILERVLEDRGDLSLDFIRDLPAKKAAEYLESFPGVGPKTAACVLLFSCRKQVFPVDTHVARITRRLDWAPERASPDAIQALLEPVIPPGIRYALHVNLIAHGRTLCRPREPECDVCPILSCCATGQARGERATPAARATR